MNQEAINSTLNSSQLHDYGYAERKRYGQYNNASDIFNVKEKPESELDGGRNALSRSRRFQHHHYQSTCPYGRDDITVDNPHNVHVVYQEHQPTNPSTGGMMMPSTEPNYGYPSEITATEGGGAMPRSREGRRRGMTPPSAAAAASNGIERQEDIFVSREELQTPEQRKEALMKRQKLDQLLNGGGGDGLAPAPAQAQAPPPVSEAMTEKSKNATFAAPYATSYDMKKKDASAPTKPLNSKASVSSLAPFATIEYNPYENYANARRSFASAQQQQQLQAQAQAFNQHLPHDHDLPISSDPVVAHAYHQAHTPSPHTHVHDESGPFHPQGHPSPSLQTPYFHETSSRPMPKEDHDHDLPRDYMGSISTDVERKGMEREEDIPPELLQQMASSSGTVAPSRHHYNMPSSMRCPEGPEGPEEGREPLSKDHITSSFDKATALTDRDYFNKIMNDPHHHHQQHPTQEEAITREKYEEAKHRFDELYRDLMNTEDLKNHPELIEELNKLTPADLQRLQSPPPDSVAGVAPPPSQMNYDSHVGKEDYMNSLEDLDKRLEKITFDDHQQTSMIGSQSQSQSQSLPQSQSQPQPQLQSQSQPQHQPQLQSQLQSQPPSTVLTPMSNNNTMDHHEPSRGRMNRRNYNESHIFDGIDEDSTKAAAAATTRPPPSTSPSEDNLSATAKARAKASNSFNNIFGTPEYHAEMIRQEQEKRRLYSRRHWKLAQQNRSDIFCLGGDTAAVAEEEKMVTKELGETQLPPEVPTTIDRRATQMNLQASSDNPMNTTYRTMCHTFNSEDRQQMKSQPTFGLSSKQSHRTYKSKSRKYTPANSSQILF